MNSRLQHLLDYPIDELYRLIVDGRFHSTQHGWLGYEQREAGSLKAALDGIALIAMIAEDETIGFDESTIKEMHETCMAHHQHKEPKPGQFRTQSHPVAGFPIEANRTTMEGLIELLDYIESFKDYPMYQGAWLGFRVNLPNGFTLEQNTAIHAHSIEQVRKLYSVSNNKELAAKIFPDVLAGKYDYLAPRAALIEKMLDDIIQSYTQKIKSAGSDDEKIHIIVDHVQQLERLHPFSDGNGRAFVNLLLNLLLMQNKLLIATFEEPNLFDAYSKADLVGAVKRAQENTAAILRGDKNIFGFNTESLGATEKQRYSLICKDVIETFAEIKLRLMREELNDLLKSLPSQPPATASSSSISLFSPSDISSIKSAITKITSLVADEEIAGFNADEVKALDNVRLKQILNRYQTSPLLTDFFTKFESYKPQSGTPMSNPLS